MIGELQRAVENYRAQYARQEGAVVDYMDAVHLRIALEIRREIEAIAESLEGVDPSGPGEARALLSRKGRLEERLEQIELRAMAYVPVLAGAMEDASGAAISMGARHGLGMMRSVVGVQFNRVPFSALRDQAAALVPGAPLDRLLRGWAGGAATAVSDQLMAGIAKGDNPRKVALDMAKALASGTRGTPVEPLLHRATTIARTETIRSYRSASIATYKANPEVVDGWIWNSAGNQTTCPVCWAMHGTKFDAGDHFESHPNCRCSPSPSVPGYDTDLPPGEELFAALPEREQLAVLGPGRYAMYARGDLRLSDLVGRSHHPVWGGGRFERSIRDVERRRRGA